MSQAWVNGFEHTGERLPLLFLRSSLGLSTSLAVTTPHSFSDLLLIPPSASQLSYGSYNRCSCQYKSCVPKISTQVGSTSLPTTSPPSKRGYTSRSPGTGRISGRGFTPLRLMRRTIPSAGPRTGSGCVFFPSFLFSRYECPKSNFL